MSTFEKFGADVTSWYWWLSVVAVGIAVNLASSYLKSIIDSWFSTRWEHGRRRQQARQQAFDMEVSQTSSDSTLLVVAGQRLHSVQFGLLATLVFMGLLIYMIEVVGSLEVRKGIAGLLGGMTMLLIGLLRREAQLSKIVEASRREYERRHDG